MTSVEALATPPTGVLHQDRHAFERLIAQVSDWNRLSPLDDLSAGEWWDRYWKLLTIDWPETIRLDPGWAVVLEAAIREGPKAFGWRWGEDSWQEALETTMAVWLHRGPESILPLLQKLADPEFRPSLVFIVVHSYLERGSYPLTPEIFEFLAKASSWVGRYSDETAEWLVHVLVRATALDLLKQVAKDLTEDQPVARSVLAAFWNRSG